ncbi:MAG: methyltransferase domain-containing protein [Clostridia bacterium]|nr:methyltransferase domain-containing protein [Clostridia bacterium]
MKRILPNKTILNSLSCPICSGNFSLKGVELERGSISLLCDGVRKHCYDLSSSGYVNFMPPGHSDGGDSKAAVRARTEFLNTDLYRPCADALTEMLAKHLAPNDGLVLDAGCGEGYYTELLARKGFSCLGFDLSRAAVDAASKRMARADHDNGFFCVGSVFELPVAENSCAAIVNIFAPCAENEFLRALRSRGILLVAYAGPEHLMGLKRAIYNTTKENDGRADLPKQMKQIDELRVRYSISVKTEAQIQNLFAMTPYYWRTSPTDAEKLRGLNELDTEVDMIFSVYRKDE